VNAPHLNPSQIGRYLIYLPQRDGWLSWPRQLVTYRDSFTCLQAVTHPSTNPAQRRVTSLIELNALPLRQATNPSVVVLKCSSYTDNDNNHYNDYYNACYYNMDRNTAARQWLQQHMLLQKATALKYSSCRKWQNYYNYTVLLLLQSSLLQRRQKSLEIITTTTTPVTTTRTSALSTNPQIRLYCIHHGA